MSSLFGGGGGGSGQGYSLTVSPSSSATSGATSLNGNISSSPLTLGGVNAGTGGMMVLAIVAVVGLALLLFHR